MENQNSICYTQVEGLISTSEIYTNQNRKWENLKTKEFVVFDEKMKRAPSKKRENFYIFSFVALLESNKNYPRIQNR